ncbi:DENN domain and WD repeat-containing protein [Arachis hypogaea]|nr:DENN domain and WD repeat-containing protein [Arachis hypogaea]
MFAFLNLQVVVDLDYNHITTSEKIPPIPEPEYRFLRGEWGADHDLQLRMIFLKFFATLLSGYRNFLENSSTQVFNTQAFLKKWSRATNQSPEPMVLLRIQKLECSKIIHLELKGTNACSKVNYHQMQLARET